MTKPKVFFGNKSKQGWHKFCLYRDLSFFLFFAWPGSRVGCPYVVGAGPKNFSLALRKPLNLDLYKMFLFANLCWKCLTSSHLIDDLTESSCVILSWSRFRTNWFLHVHRGGEPGHMQVKVYWKFKESLILIQMVQTLHTSANILHVCIHKNVLSVVTQITLKVRSE